MDNFQGIPPPLAGASPLPSLLVPVSPDPAAAAQFARALATPPDGGTGMEETVSAFEPAEKDGTAQCADIAEPDPLAPAQSVWLPGTALGERTKMADTARASEFARTDEAVRDAVDADGRTGAKFRSGEKPTPGQKDGAAPGKEQAGNNPPPAAPAPHPPGQAIVASPIRDESMPSLAHSFPASHASLSAAEPFRDPSAVAERILVGMPDRADGSREVVIKFTRDALPDTEVKLSRDGSGKLLLEFTTSSAESGRFLREHGGDLQARLKAATDAPVDMRLMFASDGDNEGDGRSRQRRDLYQEWADREREQ